MQILKRFRIVLFIIVLAILVYIGYDKVRFLRLKERTLSITNIMHLKTYFGVFISKNDGLLSQIFSDVKNAWFIFINDYWNIMLNWLVKAGIKILNYSMTLLIWGVNLGFILFLLLRNSVNKKSSKVKKTAFAKAFQNMLFKGKMGIFALKSGIRKKISWVYSKRTYCLLIVFSLTYLWITQILLEIFIFFLVYLRSVLMLNTHLLLLEILYWLILIIYKIMTSAGLSLVIIIFIGIYIFCYIKHLDAKLIKNHRRLMRFSKNELNQLVIINGVPGSGKTLLASNLGAIQEEIDIQTQEKKLRDIERKNPGVNFNEVLENPESFKEDFPHLYEYWLIYDNIHNRGSTIISNYPVHSFIYDEKSKILDVDYLRTKGKKTNFSPLELYITLIFSEIDKEFNSHDDKRKITDEGVHHTFGCISQWLERCLKMFVDYQNASQFPLRLRDTSENFINLEGKARLKAFKLLGLFEWLFKKYDRLIEKTLKAFAFEKKYVKNQSRQKPLEVKRKDYTFFYGVLRYLYFLNGYVFNWLHQKKFLKLEVSLYPSQEQRQSEVKNFVLRLNIRDMVQEGEKLYNSTFLRNAYLEKYKASDKKFRDLDKWTNINPTTDDLKKVNSDFYNEVFNLREKEVVYENDADIYEFKE